VIEFAPSEADRAAKRERLLDLIARTEKCDGVLLESPEATAWYLDGVRTTVPAGGASVVAILVTGEGDTVRCFSNELERLVAENGLPDTAEPVPWFEPLVPAVWRFNDRIAGESALTAQLRSARASLLPTERDRYRTLAERTTRMLTDVVTNATPATTERQLAGALAQQIYAFGAEPMVLLIAGESRLSLRHPVPTGETLGAHAMVVVGARQYGLVVSLTRWVSFGTADSAAAAELLRITQVEAAVLDATVPGRRVGEVFTALVSAYREGGYDTEEWMRHHQGGATGYVGRDPRATPALNDLVHESQAFAWNPSATAAKAEDTVMVTPHGIEVLTVDERWPTTLVGGRRRPLTLEL
jgi:hypothetical protein